MNLLASYQVSYETESVAENLLTWLIAGDGLTVLALAFVGYLTVFTVTLVAILLVVRGTQSL